MKEQLKKTVLEKLQNKKIVLFGAGIMAHEFYEKYKGKLDFAYCVTNNSQEWGEKRFCNALDIKRYSKEDLTEDYYIVLCIYLGFNAVEIQLEADDLKIFEDFADYKVAEGLLDGKKIALFYGTCILRDVHYMLQTVPAFTETYVSIFLQIHHLETILENRRLYYAKDICDAYIYSRKIIDLDEPYSIKREELPSECLVIGSSVISFDGYWPQGASDPNQYNEHWLFHVTAPFDNYFWHLMYAREDGNIIRLVKEGKTPEEIYEILSDDCFYSEKEVKKHMRISLKTLEMAERGLEVTVCDYIKEHYQKEKVFQDFVHLKKSVIWKYVERILMQLGVEEPQFEMIKASAPEYVHRASDMPIYPSVAKALGLEWFKEDEQYEVLTYKGMQLMTFREYVIHYAQYVQLALEIETEW